MNQSVPAFRSQYLGASQTITSGPVSATGNKVVLTCTVINVSGSATAYVDGTYDGVAWTDDITSGGMALSSFGVPATISKTSLDYAMVRVRVVAAAATKILFDSTLAFSDQP